MAIAEQLGLSQGRVSQLRHHALVELRAPLQHAAVAERHGITLLHYDGDFDLIGGVTGQRMQWVVPRGSVA